MQSVKLLQHLSSTSFKKTYSENSGRFSDSYSETCNSSLNDEPNEVEEYDEESNECYLFLNIVGVSNLINFNH